jgi:hypothetical protein
MEQLGVHRQRAHLGAQPVDRFVPIVPRPRLQAGRTRLERPVAPAAQVRRRHRQFARQDLQRLAAKNPQNSLRLAVRRHAPLPARSRDRSDT